MTAAEARNQANTYNTRKSYDWTSVMSHIEKNVNKYEVWLNQSSCPESVVNELRKDGYKVTYERGGVVIKW